MYVTPLNPSSCFDSIEKGRIPGSTERLASEKESMVAATRGVRSGEPIMGRLDVERKPEINARTVAGDVAALQSLKKFFALMSWK
jgi:hypothetical protein